MSAIWVSLWHRKVNAARWVSIDVTFVFGKLADTAQQFQALCCHVTATPTFWIGGCQTNIFDGRSDFGIRRRDRPRLPRPLAAHRRATRGQEAAARRRRGGVEAWRGARAQRSARGGADGSRSPVRRASAPAPRRSQRRRRRQRDLEGRRRARHAPRRGCSPNRGSAARPPHTYEACLLARASP